MTPTDPHGWNDAAVVVTGGSRGIGLAVARAVVDRGARVGLVARDGSDLGRAATELGPGTVVYPADVTQRRAVEDAMAWLRERLGRIDVLVASAGAGAVGRITSDARAGVAADVGAGTAVQVGTDAERLMAVNFAGVVSSTLAVLPGMLEQGHGHIVVIGSIAGRLGVAGEAAYSASKFAVTGFAEALALELRASGVGVSLVSPGAVDTGFFTARGVPYQRRWPRPIAADTVARAVLRAVERDRFDVIVPAWLRVPVALRAVAPRFYRWAATRA